MTNKELQNLLKQLADGKEIFINIYRGLFAVRDVTIVKATKENCLPADIIQIDTY